MRFEFTYQTLAPGLKIIAPWREWDLNSRESLMAYAEKSGIPVPVSKAKPYSTDNNLLHISFEGGILEDPWAAPAGGHIRVLGKPGGRSGQASRDNHLV